MGSQGAIGSDTVRAEISGLPWPHPGWNRSPFCGLGEWCGEWVDEAASRLHTFFGSLSQIFCSALPWLARPRWLAHPAFGACANWPCARVPIARRLCWAWLAAQTRVDVAEFEDGVNFELKPNQDESTIDYYLAEYRDTFLELPMFSFKPALVTLNALNYFPLRTFHTSALLDWNLSSIPLWQKCNSKFGDALPLARKGLKSVKPT